MAEEHKMNYFEVSAKTKIGVEDMMKAIVNQVYLQKFQPEEGKEDELAVPDNRITIGPGGNAP